MASIKATGVVKTPPRTVAMMIVAQDPAVLDKRSRDSSRKILRAWVRVPADRLEAGPRGPRLQVVDYDATTGKLAKPAKLSVLKNAGELTDHQLVTDPAFRAWNVYAIAARTLAAFEFALGRRVPWGFGSHQLFLVPSALADLNAYYSDDDRALLFGYFPEHGTRRTAFTSLSHDIVAHETAHAILDGLRSGFFRPGLPDQAAFHEGFADVVALLQVFSVPEVVEVLLGGPRSKRLRAEDVKDNALQESALFRLGEQFGDAVHERRGASLRRSVKLKPRLDWRDPANLEWQEPHQRGEILVAAITQTLVLMWRRRLKELIHMGSLNRKLAAEEGAKAARHLLEMSIRAIDYCPPVDFEFEDFLTAVLISDAEVAPDDQWDYRTALTDAFGSFGIKPGDLAGTAPKQPLSLRDFSLEALRAERDEVFRFVWENASALGINLKYHLQIEDVVTSTRIGPNGFVVQETIANYVQQLSAPAGQLRSALHELTIPESVDNDTKITMFGGGVLVFDQFGTVKHHLAKPLAHWARQSRRLQFLVDQEHRDTAGGVGASFGTPRGQRFAQFHQAGDRSSEEW